MTCGRRQRNDRFSTFRQSCSANEVHLTTNTRVMICTDRIGTNLPGDIYLNSTVDGRHLWIHSDYRCIVDIVNIQHRNRRIVVDEVIQLAGSQQETGSYFSAMLALEF